MSTTYSANITVPLDEIPDLLIPAAIDTVLMVSIVMVVVLVWAVIAACHLSFRRRWLAEGRSLEDLAYRAPGYPWVSIAALGLSTASCLLIVFDPEQRGSLAITAVFLVEYNGGWIARVITFLVDVMTGIPSIVAGLFGLAVFIAFMPDQSVRMGIMGAVALSLLMIPTVVRNSEEMLRLVPMDLREAAYALGVPKWLTIVKVVLPTAVAGLATGVTLAIARVMGETAPLLITMGAAKAVNFNPFDGSMSALPLFAYSSYANNGSDPTGGLLDAAWTAALVLMVIVMVLNIVARLISKFFAPKTGR